MLKDMSKVKYKDLNQLNQSWRHGNLQQTNLMINNENKYKTSRLIIIGTILLFQAKDFQSLVSRSDGLTILNKILLMGLNEDKSTNTSEFLMKYVGN